jgi:RNA polymerase sigma-70 factor (ECF subfamily)
MDKFRGDMDGLIDSRGVDDPVVTETMLIEFSAPVYRLALSILHDPADSQDVAQDTFIQAAAALRRYQVGTNFKAWLLKIAVNNCRMVLRRRRRQQALQRVWESLAGLAPRQPGPETQVVQGETRDELWDLVENLDEKHRLVVVLRLAHDMTVAEIAQVLEVNEKTVYTRLYDAFARLRGQIRLRPEFAHLRDEVQP